MVKGSPYERELLKILAGDEETIINVIKTLPGEIGECYKLLIGKPFASIRSAGSLGIDIIAFRGDLVLPIEVKSSKHKSIGFSGEKMNLQYEWTKKLGEDTDTTMFYGYRYKTMQRIERWEIFRVEGTGDGDKFLDVPIIPKTYDDNPILRFGDGMLLSDFLGYIY